jgi:hypothetical protein
MTDTSPVQSPEPYPPDEPYDEPGERFVPDVAWIWGAGERLTWLSGLILSLSTLMGWYVSVGEEPTFAVIGWHTGALAKIVLVIGLLVVALHLLHVAGIELPATVPESLIVIVLGSLATILVLIRLISIPEEFQPAGRGIGIWISLVAALLVIVAGLLRASEDL